MVHALWNLACLLSSHSVIAQNLLLKLTPLLFISINSRFKNYLIYFCILFLIQPGAVFLFISSTSDFSFYKWEDFSALFLIQYNILSFWNHLSFMESNVFQAFFSLLSLTQMKEKIRNQSTYANLRNVNINSKIIIGTLIKNLQFYSHYLQSSLSSHAPYFSFSLLTHLLRSNPIPKPDYADDIGL